MKVTVENKKGLNKDIKVFIDKETMNSYMDEKYEEIKKTVNLKGFRPGKVPKEVLKRQFGQAIFSEVLDKVLKDTSVKALEDNKIKPAGQPLLKLTITFQIDVAPTAVEPFHDTCIITEAGMFHNFHRHGHNKSNIALRFTQGNQIFQLACHPSKVLLQPAPPPF